jgi:hypothetical protein
MESKHDFRLAVGCLMDSQSQSCAQTLLLTLERPRNVLTVSILPSIPLQATELFSNIMTCQLEIDEDNEFIFGIKSGTI